MKRTRTVSLCCAVGLLFLGGPVFGQSGELKKNVYDMGKLKPIDSELKVETGQPAPDFSLPSVSGKKISLSSYKGKKNVVLSFVPAAFTTVCSVQWPGYDIVKDAFDDGDAILLGITVDNIPTLHAWTSQMGKLPFEALSDFWPHGKAASSYGVLRPDGTTERALFLVDKQGVIRWIDVHDINKRPPLEDLIEQLDKLD